MRPWKSTRTSAVPWAGADALNHIGLNHSGLNNSGLNNEMQRTLAQTLEHLQQVQDAGAAIDLPIAEENSERVQARIEVFR